MQRVRSNRRYASDARVDGTSEEGPLRGSPARNPLSRKPVRSNRPVRPVSGAAPGAADGRRQPTAHGFDGYTPRGDPVRLRYGRFSRPSPEGRTGGSPTVWHPECPTNTPGRSGMRLSSAGSSTGQFPDPPGGGDGSGGDGSTIAMLVKPVFTRDSRAASEAAGASGYLAAAGLRGLPRDGAGQRVRVAVGPAPRRAPRRRPMKTSVQQVTPERRPSAKPSPPPAHRPGRPARGARSGDAPAPAPARHARPDGSPASASVAPLGVREDRPRPRRPPGAAKTTAPPASRA
jgi:hypothetical protein